MINYLVNSIIKSKVDNNPIIVVSPDNIDIIKEYITYDKCLFTKQDKQLGT
jgi:hypothetical protein